MLVLGIESSCDETAAAVVDGGTRALSDVVASQVDVHRRFGGVVPELASRAHIAHVAPVVEEALRQAGVKARDLEGIACTRGPGLMGALLVGLQYGKALAYALDIPWIGVHHLAGHMCAVRLEPDPPPYPHLALVVSGGHTSLIRVDGPLAMHTLGATRDDAVGEAYDKVAKMLGLGYPGGPLIDRLAASGEATAVAMPRLMTASRTDLDFSYSGLKTAVLNQVRAEGIPTGQGLADLAASFQASACEVLVRKSRRALRRERLRALQVCGGVAANSHLRATLRSAAERDGFSLWMPAPDRCTDNAAMIAAIGTIHLQRGDRSTLTEVASARMALPGERSAS